MKFLANENIPLATIRDLRLAGFDVTAIAETRPSIPDSEVLAIARKEKRIVITFDRDYGELIYARGNLPPEGVLYLRVAPLHPSEPSEWLQRIVREGIPLVGNFTIFSGWNHIRQRVLPPSPDV
jgi:predicted nuclease of predicted toxin-antitoxin system